MVSLTKIAKHHNTDKGPSKHNYTLVYDRVLSSLRLSYITLLEIGVASGASINMWLDYFRYGLIYGIDRIDFNTNLIPSERFTFIKGNQSEPGVLRKVTHLCSGYDVIIDDGSHLPADQTASFIYLFPFLKNGGYYIIEDLNYKNRTGLESIRDVLKRFAHERKGFSKHIERNVETVTFYCDDKLVVIKKTGSLRYSKPKITEQDIKKEIKNDKKITLDFTTTATVRPEIIDSTYRSFVNNLKGVDFNKSTLYLNIDPIPKIHNPLDVVNVAKKYFGNVVYNVPKVPSYSQAFNWCWSMANSDYILNLEDDWELVKQIDIQELLQVFSKIKTLYMVILRAYSYVYPACVTSPALVSKYFYKKVAGKLNPNINPENQIHTRGRVFGLDMPFKRNGIDPTTRVMAYPFDLKDIIVKDLGREWMDKQTFCRPEKKSEFTTWIPK